MLLFAFLAGAAWSSGAALASARPARRSTRIIATIPIPRIPRPAEPRAGMAGATPFPGAVTTVPVTTVAPSTFSVIASGPFLAYTGPHTASELACAIAFLMSGAALLALTRRGPQVGGDRSAAAS